MSAQPYNVTIIYLKRISTPASVQWHILQFLAVYVRVRLMLYRQVKLFTVEQLHFFRYLTLSKRRALT